MKYTSSSKRTKSITWMPGWLLKMKGKKDSKNGVGVCDEYIKKFEKRLASLEAKEVMDAENALFETRKEAAVILMNFTEQKKVLSEKIGESKDNIVSIRMGRKVNGRKKDAREKLKSGLEKLTMMNEEMINVETILTERIDKMRDKAMEKVHCYVIGAKCGSLKDYEGKMTFSSAQEIYHKKHQELDKKISEVVGFKINEEVSA